jgi:hypothetical protein
MVAVIGARFGRAAGGAAVATVAPSHWLLVAGCFAASFVAAVRRLRQLIAAVAQPPRRATDQTRTRLPPSPPRAVVGGRAQAYCVWAFGPRHDVWLASASVVTLTLLFLRCALVVDQPGGDAALERDHAPWALGLLWVALYVGAASV